MGSPKRYFFIPFLLLIGLSNILQAQVTIPDELIVDYTARDKPLREVLFELCQQAEVTIAFQEEVIPGDSLINFTVKEEKLGVVIDYLLTRHSVKYKIVGNQIVLFKDPYRKSNDKITISGYLRDLETGESLISANVYVYDKSLGTVSNEYGFYSFTIPKGLQRVHYSYLGYQITVKELKLSKDTVVNVSLDPVHLLNEIIITDTKIIPKEPKVASQPPAVDVLPLQRLNSFLPVGGEPDIMRLAYTLPGVTSGADGFGGMSVRGGSTNQNLILFDGIPVYNANHLFGLFSIFNSNVIKSAKIYKGAFPSHYSGRLSSVVDIRTRDGNNQKLSGDITLGILTGKVSLEGPIQKGKSSFLISYRRTTVDPWIKSLSDLLNDNPLIERNTQVKFYDFNTKLNFSLGENSKILFSYYQGKDFFDNVIQTDNEEMNLRDFDELSWDSANQLASLRWNTKLSNKAFLNVSSYLSNHTFTSFDHDRIEILDSSEILSSVFDAGYYKTDIRDIGFKVDMDYNPSATHNLKIGTGLLLHTFSPQFIFATHRDSLVQREEQVTTRILRDNISEFSLKGTELEFYIEDNIRLSKHTNINIGINQLIVNSGKTYFIFQPRILFNTGTEKYNLRLSWGRMGQFLHSLSNTGLGVPSDIWLPSTANLAPETSWIASIGNYYQLGKTSNVGVEVYYKKLNNVTRYGTGVLRVSENSNWDKTIPVGEGTSYGAEFSTSLDIRKTTFNLGYTWSRSNRRFEGLRGGDSFRFRYDRRHVINASATFKFNENIEFSSNFEYGSGTPITLPSNKSYNYVDDNGNFTRVRVFGDINNDELPDYHRLDLGFNFYNKYKWGKSKLTLGVYNVYNKINPLYIDEIVNADFTTRYEQFYLFKFMPTVSYNISF